ncbi:MAG: hypothetical protein K8H89_11745 [Flavobacteriales bacterium]|jgi:predicted nucleic acid-binding protein|nr:hypothetical protein [Flavobacteriales bacterium]
MKALLDTNIVIHREAVTPAVHGDVGVLYRWLDRLRYEKCVHPVTVAEIGHHRDIKVVQAMSIKLDSYTKLLSVAPLADEVKRVCAAMDKGANDQEDTKLINEVFVGRVDVLITEDRKIHAKACALGIELQVLTIERFLEQAITDHPDLIDYKVLSVRKRLFGELDVQDAFFDSFRADYVDPPFDRWFQKRANDHAYVYTKEDSVRGFLFLKTEDRGENYSDITPVLAPAKRLKIGTLKVVADGLRMGERFLKIAFDNAREAKVDEIYVTIFERSPEQLRLIELLTSWGFVRHGAKATGEAVFVRPMKVDANASHPKETYPKVSKAARVWVVPIKPEYHTELFPDSILRTEKADAFVDGEPHRNAISKAYVSHSPHRDLSTGDILVFYRTGGIHKGVVSTIGIVENVVNPVADLDTLRKLCRKKSALEVEELKEYWERFGSYKPFVINFLYAYSLKHRQNLRSLLDAGIFPNMDIVRTINELPMNAFVELVRLGKL